MIFYINKNDFMLLCWVHFKLSFFVIFEISRFARNDGIPYGGRGVRELAAKPPIPSRPLFTQSERHFEWSEAK